LTDVNYSIEIGQLNTLRNDSVTVPVAINVDNSSYLEKIDDGLHISEYLRNLKNADSIKEYRNKTGMLNHLSSIYDGSYALNTWMLPSGIENQVIPQDNKLVSISIEDEETGIVINNLISGYIKVVEAPSDIELNFILRGIPLPMRKVQTSTNYDETLNAVSYNYYFIYPQYLINNIELVQAIQYIEILNSSASTKFYYGNNSQFELIDLEGYDNRLANLHILNKEFRNILATENSPV
jgi:hypothetical protein